MFLLRTAAWFSPVFPRFLPTKPNMASPRTVALEKARFFDELYTQERLQTLRQARLEIDQLSAKLDVQSGLVRLASLPLSSSLSPVSSAYLQEHQQQGSPLFSTVTSRSQSQALDSVSVMLSQGML